MHTYVHSEKYAHIHENMKENCTQRNLNCTIKVLLKTNKRTNESLMIVTGSKN